MRRDAPLRRTGGILCEGLFQRQANYPSQGQIGMTPSWPPPPLQTKRLRLLAPSEANLHEALLKPTPLVDRPGLPGNWTISLKKPDQAIGSIGYIRWLRAEGLGELGFILTHRYRGFGYMSEACRAVMAFGFDALGLKTIEGRSLPHNQASVRLLLRLGMKKEARVQARLFSKGAPVDLDIYRIRKA